MCINESQDVLRGAEAVKPTDHEVEQSCGDMGGDNV